MQFLGPPGPAELVDALRAVLRDWSADGRLSDLVLRRIQVLLARAAAGEPSLPVPVTTSDARPLMPPEKPRLPTIRAERTGSFSDDEREMSDEERKFLREFARNGVASRRVWKVTVFACGGIAAIAGAVVALISLARAINPSN